MGAAILIPLEGIEMGKKIFGTGESVTTEPAMEGVSIEPAAVEPEIPLMAEPVEAAPAEQPVALALHSAEEVGRAVIGALVRGNSVSPRKLRIDVLNSAEIRLVEQPDGGKVISHGVFRIA